MAEIFKTMWVQVFCDHLYINNTKQSNILKFFKNSHSAALKQPLGAPRGSNWPFSCKTQVLCQFSGPQTSQMTINGHVHKYQHLVWTFQKTPKTTFCSKIFKSLRILTKFSQLLLITISNWSVKVWW